PGGGGAGRRRGRGRIAGPLEGRVGGRHGGADRARVARRAGVTGDSLGAGHGGRGGGARVTGVRRRGLGRGPARVSRNSQRIDGGLHRAPIAAVGVGAGDGVAARDRAHVDREVGGAAGRGEAAGAEVDGAPQTGL